MNFEPLLNNAVSFTRETLVLDWTRWLVFILLGLPGALLPFVLGIRDMSYKSDFRWDLVQWDQVAVLIILMLLASFFLSGYIVRIYRGSGTPPAFDQWPGLFLDGIRLNVVWIIWILPALNLLLLACATLFLSSMGGGWRIGTDPLLLVLALVLLLAAMVLGLVAVILGTIGAIRYSRTGSVLEGVNYREVLETIRRIGWWDYIIAGLILCVIAIVFSLVTMALAFIPVAGWLLVLVISPFITIFSARFLSQVYDTGVIPAQNG